MSCDIRSTRPWPRQTVLMQRAPPFIAPLSSPTAARNPPTPSSLSLSPSRSSGTPVHRPAPHLHVDEGTAGQISPLVRYSTFPGQYSCLSGRTRGHPVRRITGRRELCTAPCQTVQFRAANFYPGRPACTRSQFAAYL